MKTSLGGDRLGSGGKQEVSTRHYNRSTHDLSYLWRSSMASGTLVPFMSKVGLPGDVFDIKLNCEVLTLPTVGPLFGSYKVQLDVFSVPIRLYNAGLHMNKLNIGNDMSEVKLPLVEVKANNHASYEQTLDDNEQVNASALFKYLGIAGVGHLVGATNPATRKFNAVPYLAYWDIYKNYYANKQEERGYVIHTGSASAGTMTSADLKEDLTVVGDILDVPTLHTGSEDTNLTIQFTATSLEPDPEQLVMLINGNTYTLNQAFASVIWNDSTKQLECEVYKNVEVGAVNWEVETQALVPIGGVGSQLTLEEFNLTNIDDMREDILQYPFSSGAFVITSASQEPYGLPMVKIGGGANLKYCCEYSQEGLGIKTYQSDLFNNWISTEWIDGVNGVNAVTAVDTTGDSFTIDSLNLASKVYDMLNRIALSGGSYDNWLDAVYTKERAKGVDSPVYHGSLIKELAFQEVISNAENADAEQPLGTLAGRGRLTDKHKGGKMIVKCDEPSYIMGIASITPRIEYSQGNKWDMSLETLDDLHKPALDAIGFQDLITEQMCWTSTELNADTGVLSTRSAGKQPAWINYMTEVNRCYGNFAVETKDMFMVLNRRYEKFTDGSISDLTTYIDPTKFNHIFAQTELDAQNFWVQISNDITARRLMSAKVIPNL